MEIKQNPTKNSIYFRLFLQLNEVVPSLYNNSFVIFLFMFFVQSRFPLDMSSLYNLFYTVAICLFSSLSNIPIRYFGPQKLFHIWVEAKHSWMYYGMHNHVVQNFYRQYRTRNQVEIAMNDFFRYTTKFVPGSPTPISSQSLTKLQSRKIYAHIEMIWKKENIRKKYRLCIIFLSRKAINSLILGVSLNVADSSKYIYLETRYFID